MDDSNSSMRSDRQFKFPSLTQYCYKYINSHLDSIQSLGSLPFSICEPILRSCSAEQLLTVENNSPHLLAEDQDIWQNLCCRDFPRLDQSVRNNQLDPSPSCWREQYLTCLREEEKRFEEIGSRLRIRREEVDQEKKGRQVIVTDKLLPSKRTRLNSGTGKSKSLFAKAKADSLKFQRLFHNPSTLPSMHSKSIKPRMSVPPLKPPPPPPASSSLSSSPSKSVTLTRPLSGGKPSTSASNNKASNSTITTTAKITLSPSSSATSVPVIPQSTRNNTSPAKKDPMAALFMPKHKAYSQRPSNPPIDVRRK